MDSERRYESRVETAFFDIAIVGAGVAGLATAIRLKDTYPNLDIAVIEKSSPESNSQIAGQRYRTRTNFRSEEDTDALISLMGERNQGIITPQMKLFCETGVESVARWTQDYQLPYADKREWFGPQLGGSQRPAGHGKRVLGHMRAIADSLSINFLEGQVIDIERSGDTLDSIDIVHRQGLIRCGARALVLASGGAGGTLFHSTNKRIRGSAHELAIDAALPLVGATVTMLHPFGRSTPDGAPRVGCYETDRLAGASIYIGQAQDVFDQETSELLNNHAAHQHMGAIARRFYEFGSVVAIEPQEGIRSYARVSHHHSHLGIQTADGVSVAGISNGFAVGDASDIGYWTAYQERLPGVALTKCLIDAELVSERILDALSGASKASVSTQSRPAKTTLSLDSEVVQSNTDFLIGWKMARSTHEQLRVAEQWRAALETDTQENRLTVLSKKIATAHLAAASGQKEPIVINTL